MADHYDTISVETEHHVIEMSEGYLTIGEKNFPDDCVSLSPEETEEVLKLLLKGKQVSLVPHTKE